LSNILYVARTNEPNKFHVGFTKNNRPPIERFMRDSDYSKLPYIPQVVKQYFIDDLTDHPFHGHISRMGAMDLRKLGLSRSPEIFQVEGENPEQVIVDYVESALEIERTGVRSFSKVYDPRPHQAWVNQEILNRWDGQETIIQPLNLCARFGKTLQGLSLFNDSGLQVMVLAAHWLAANNSFVSAVNERFDIAADVVVIKTNYEEFKAAIDKSQRVLIDLSLHTEAEKIDPQLINALQEYQSLVYIDEADHGAWTPSSRETASQFIDSGINLVCVATGTNIDRALIGTRGHIEAPITVSYLDLIEAKRGEGHLFQPGGFCSDDPQRWQNTLSDIVEVDVLNIDVAEDLKEEFNDMSVEKRPNMPKTFAKRNSHIQRKIIISLLYDEEFGADVFGMYDERYGSIEHPAAMMFIPGTKADVNNIVKMGESIAPHYNWIALHGDDYTNRTAEQAVKDAIKSGGERTVIVSCSMGARSFSVPNIIAVINCKDGGSVGTAVQQASRCFTPGCGKTHGLVVNYSFNSERTSAFENDLISSAIAQDPSNADAAIRRVHGLVNFFKKDSEGYMIDYTEGDYLQYVTSVENLNNMGKATIDMEGLIANIDLLNILEGIKSNTNTSKEWKGIIEKAQTFIQSEEKKGKKEVDVEKKAVRDLIKKITRIVECTANTYYMAPNYNTFKDCLSEIACNPDKNAEYTRLVGVNADIVYNDIYQFLNPSIMDLIITKADKLDSMDNFSSSSSKHSETFLFNV